MSLQRFSHKQSEEGRLCHLGPSSLAPQPEDGPSSFRQPLAFSRKNAVITFERKLAMNKNWEGQRAQVF